MSIRLDFTTKSGMPEVTSVKTHTFMDIGTNNFRLEKNHADDKLILSDANSTNFDKMAIKNSLNNILNFRTR
jgi:hypothetical protein